MSTAELSPKAAPEATARTSYLDVWLITIGHAFTHWYPATFFLLLPPPAWDEAMGTEYFERPVSHVAAPAQEDDLFAGLRD